MTDLVDRWLAGRVRRFHTSPGRIEQNLADHSWGVAYLLDQLYPEPGPPARLYRAALRHDLAESVTGDVPATFKWANPTVKEALQKAEDRITEGMFGGMPVLHYEEKVWLKACDMLELVLSAAHAVRQGDRYANKLVTNGVGFLANLRDCPVPVWTTAQSVQSSLMMENTHDHEAS